jgi:hypothetical protein
MPERKHGIDALVSGLTNFKEESPAPLDVVDAKKNNFNYKKYKHDKKDVIVKTFNQDSYRGPSLRDFIIRSDMIYKLTEKKLRENNQGAELDRKLERLNQAREACVDLLKRECTVEPTTADQRRYDKKIKAQLSATIKQATEIIQDFLFQGIALTAPDAFESHANLTAVLREYQADESLLTAEEGRPDFVNFYPNPVPGSDQKGGFISVQRTIGHTIPSTERFNRKPYENKLPNFVECGVYYKDVNGTIQPEFKGFRHSSYTPIRVENSYNRQKAAAEIVKGMLIELAKQEQLNNPNLNQPILLNLSSLALLTPYHRTDMLIPAKEEYEYRQLEESYEALMFYNNREVKLSIDGKEISVQLNVTMMNAPSNPAGVFFAKRRTPLKLVHSSLEDDINTQGMSKFIQQGCSFLKDNQFAEEMKNIFKQDASGLEFRLAKKYETLSSTQGSHTYFKIKQEIKQLNQQIFRLEHARIKACRDYLKTNRKSMVAFLEDLKSQNPKSNEDQVCELFFQTLLMYFDGQVEPNQYGARFLLASQKMGSHADFYCKSGEDRTGRMQNMVEELCIFYRNYGYYPRYDANKKSMEPEDQKIQSQIAVMVHEFSVSNDITGENSRGARGLQIGEGLKTNQTLPASVGDQMGKMAKGIYSLRHTGVQNEIAKKIYGLRIDTSRQHLLKETLNKNKADVLVVKTNAQGFSSRLMRVSERKSSEAQPAPRAVLQDEIKATKETSYIAHRLGENDLIVIEKKYNDVVGCIEKDAKMVRDMTKAPPGGLSREINEELAIEHAFAMIAPPFNPKISTLVLSGTDQEQVARIQAVLLILHNKLPDFKELEVKVDEAGMRPDLSTDAHIQKKNNESFIRAHLSDSACRQVLERQSELSQLIEKQRKIKFIVNSERQEGKLNILEGSEVKISPK